VSKYSRQPVVERLSEGPPPTVQLIKEEPSKAQTNIYMRQRLTFPNSKLTNVASLPSLRSPPHHSHEGGGEVTLKLSYASA